MTILSSTDPSGFPNLDPEPWVYDGLNQYGQEARFATGPGHDSIHGWSVNRPRPEYATIPAHAHNGLLAAYRKARIGIDFEDRVTLTGRWLENLRDLSTVDSDNPIATATGTEIEHARRVLERIMSFSTWALADPKPLLSQRGVRYEPGAIFMGVGKLTLDPRPEYLPTSNTVKSAAGAPDLLAELVGTVADALNAWDSQAEHDALESIAGKLGLDQDASSKWGLRA